MKNESIKRKVDALVEDIDKNKDKEIDHGEKENFDEKVEKQLEEIRFIMAGSDVLKRQALTMAIIEVAEEYKGISVDDIYQWINKRPTFVTVGVGGKIGTMNSRPDSRGIVSVKGNSNVIPLDDPSHDIESIDAFQRLNDFAGGKVEASSFKSLSTDQKVLLLLNFGNEAKEGYSDARLENHISSDRVSQREFLDKMLKRKKVRFLIEQSTTYKLGLTGLEADIPKDSAVVPTMLEGISKILLVDYSELKKLWDASTCKDNFYDNLIKKYLSSGVCRDAAVFQAKMARDMGLPDTFVTTVSQGGKAHAISGFRNEKGNISFIDWGTLIETDTPNMRLALAFLERQMGSVALRYQQSKGSESGSQLVPLKSAASETMEEMARGTDKQPEQVTSEALDAGGGERREGLDFFVEREKTALDLNLHTLGGTTLISARYFAPNTPENSISEAESLRVAQEYGKRHLVAGLGTSIAHLSLKGNLDTQKQDLCKLFINLYAKAHGKVKITKNIEYQISAIVDAIVDLELHHDFNPTRSSDEVELATGHRLSYITSDLQLYVGMQSLHSVVHQNIQQGGIDPRSFTMVNDLLAANLGMDVQLGSFSGYKVNFATQGQVGSLSAGLATEYKGSATLEAHGATNTLYVKGDETYTASHDFRIGESSRSMLTAGYIRPIKGRVLELRGFVFNDVSLGQFKDNRLDNFGAGFNASCSF